MQLKEGERILCKFCEALAEEKECHRVAQRWATDAELTEYGKWMAEYTVAIVIRDWYEKKGKKSAGRTVYYRNQGLGFALNYCPECGKKLRGKSKCTNTE
jgi:hypothetical protein